MRRATTTRIPRIPRVAFAVVEEVGLTLPGVTVATKYDGSPLLKLGALVRLSRIDRDALRTSSRCRST